MKPDKEIYYFVILTANLVNPAALLSIANIRNAQDPTPGAITKMIYW